MRWADKFAMETFRVATSGAAGRGESEPELDPRPTGEGERGRREREIELDIVPRRSRLGVETPTHIDEWDAETVDEIPEAFEIDAFELEIDEPFALRGVIAESERAPFHSALLRPARAEAERAAGPAA